MVRQRAGLAAASLGILSRWPGSRLIENFVPSGRVAKNQWEPYHLLKILPHMNDIEYTLHVIYMIHRVYIIHMGHMIRSPVFLWK